MASRDFTGRSWRWGRIVALFVTLCAAARAQRLAYDEFDGSHRRGFAKPGLGEWAIAGAFESDGALHTVGGNDWRKLATPIDGGVVWYAVTLRMEQPIAGYATVAPSPTANGQFSEFGFNSGYGAGDGLFTSSGGVVHDAIPATERQTLLARYDFAKRRWSAWAAKGDGLALLNGDGEVYGRFAPLVRDATLTPSGIGWLYLSKGSPQTLALERVALARSARDALTPVEGAAAAVDPAASQVVGDGESPAPPTGVAALTAADSPLRANDKILFFGDSTTWQGGYVDLLAQALEQKRPEMKVALLKRGINGGKSTDLRDGCHDLYGCTQKPFAEEVAAERATAVVIYVGINDVWHGEKGNPPEAYAAALKSMIASAQAAGAVVVVATPTLIGELPRGRNPFDEKLDRYAVVALDTAKSCGAIGVDLRGAFFRELARARAQSKPAAPPAGAAAEPRAEEDKGTLTYDGVHMLPAGDTLLANELAAALARALHATRDDPLSLVPWPKSVTLKPGTLHYPGSLADLARLADSGDVARVPAREMVEIALDLAPTTGFGDEGYRLVIDDRIHITAARPQGVAWAVATLLQLARGSDGTITLPHVEIADAPDCSYRGLLVDVARQPHSVATLEALIELCQLYKIRWLQLHLTDDQSFTFPSTAYPKLATPGRSYTLEELRHLEKFSQAHGVTIVPEIEMPGHCGAAIAAMGELLRASQKHHATIDFAKPEAVACMETLVAESLDAFQSTPWFHIGGDECDLEFVHENPDFPRACAREKVADPHALYCWFVAHMNEVVKRHGRKMLVWEGFGHGAQPSIPLDVTVMVYESAYHLPDCLAHDGYPIINATWEPLYVVNDRKWEPAEIYRWDRFYWKHFIESFPAFKGLRLDPTSNVLGAQMCAWEQTESLELPSLRHRLAAMSERLWNPAAARDFADFSRRLAITDRRLTDLLATPPSK